MCRHALTELYDIDYTNRWIDAPHCIPPSYPNDKNSRALNNIYNIIIKIITNKQETYMSYFIVCIFYLKMCGANRNLFGVIRYASTAVRISHCVRRLPCE